MPRKPPPPDPSRKPIIPPRIEGLHEGLAQFQERTIRKLMAEKAARECEALRLYEPLPEQQKFHDCIAPEIIVIGGNRGGKTTPIMVEVAWAATGQHPMEGKYPKKDGRIVMVAQDEKHIATVFYAKLCRAMAFRMIKDSKTGKWRTFRRWTEEDKDREKEAKFAPPLIPSRMIKHISWRNKKEQVPSKIIMHNGWEIMFYTANSTPPRGIDIDLAVFDEEVDNPEFYPEIAARLGDRHGRFIWGATPQTGTEELLELHNRAMDEAVNEEVPSIVEFEMDLRNNKYFPPEEIRKMERKYANSPDEFKVRIEGKFNTSSYLVYPTFSMARTHHGCEPFRFDDNWNLYAVIDPGRSVCAVLFFAVPPPDHPKSHQRFLFDELYLRNCNSDIFGECMLSKTAGRRFKAFLIDPSAANHDITGGGDSVQTQYTKALASRRIESEHTGSGFIPAFNEINSGILKVESWLYHRVDTGEPRLQVFEERCRWFLEEIKAYRRRKINGVIQDKPVGKNDHAMDCLRYFCCYDPRWEEPKKKEAAAPIYEAFQELQKKQKRLFGGEHVSFGNRRS